MSESRLPMIGNTTQSRNARREGRRIPGGIACRHAQLVMSREEDHTDHTRRGRSCYFAGGSLPRFHTRRRRSGHPVSGSAFGYSSREENSVSQRFAIGSSL